ncbi:helix-turn-helix domain-containing protein [Prosthecobacter sp.]|uniref:helix-turn-helix domain-containing protein n=1 Tax=Prosthecobacter sp. TaxID=1965333 RepID=UPI003783BB52
MKSSESSQEKFSFEKRWAKELKSGGFVPVSAFFLENYHRLQPYDLTYGEAMFIVHIMQHKWDEKAPFPGYKTISKRMHVSPKSARRMAASLENKGYLKREMRIGTTNLFHLKGLMTALVALKNVQEKSKPEKEDQ